MVGSLRDKGYNIQGDTNTIENATPAKSKERQNSGFDRKPISANDHAEKLSLLTITIAICHGPFALTQPGQ